MTIKNKFNVFLPIIVFLVGMFPILYNIGTMGLLEPTEALIGSVSRYMVDHKNLSTPIFNGIKHFEYAPGVYWITSLGIRIFGANELGARFFLSVAAGITALCIFAIAKLFFGLQCGLITGLLLCTSALFQISFRTISVAAYCTMFESIVCLVFFHYLNKPTLLFRHTFWIVLSIGFMFCGFSILLPIIALTAVAIFTGQQVQIKKLYFFIPGIITFILFGLGWYLIQMIVNPGLFTFWLFKLPFDDIFNNYQGVPFYLYLFLPLIAVFPWTTIWFQELKNKIKDYKEDPVVTYLVSWAFFPFIIRLLMTSRECSHFMTSLPPLLLLTAPAFQTLYVKKDDTSESSLLNIKQRRKHNLILALSAAILGMISATYGYLNHDYAPVISKTQIFTGIAWLFSALIILAFMVKKLNKSALVPAAMLIPSLILFTVPAIQGQENISQDTYLPSQCKLLRKIGSLPSSDFVFCFKTLKGSYFYAGKDFKVLYYNGTLDFVTEEGKNLYLNDKSLENSDTIKQDSYFVLESNSLENASKILKQELQFSFDGYTNWQCASFRRKN